MTILPCKKASELADDAKELAWLVEGLWGDGAVGILGGEPKSCKSILSLELAIAVSSGKSCLSCFPVPSPGRVILYAAEDSSQIVKSRLGGIAAARGVALADCDIQVITVESLRLDKADDVAALEETVAALAPKLLILDPFVRLHRIDENSSAEVAVILANLRLIQRRHGTAILVVHHAKKNGGSARAGQALRGSSEFHAWGDSNLYMRRAASDRLSLTIEHRAAPSRTGIPIALKIEGGNLSLEIQEEENQPTLTMRPTSVARIEQALTSNPSPTSLSALREASGLRTATLCATLKTMLDEGLVRKTQAGYILGAQ